VSYGYSPKFDGPALAAFRALELWLQEAVLDEVDVILNSVPAPDVAQRLRPDVTIHDFSRTAGGVEHVVFLTTVLDVPARLLHIRRIGRTRRP